MTRNSTIKINNTYIYLNQILSVEEIFTDDNELNCLTIKLANNDSYDVYDKKIQSYILKYLSLDLFPALP